MRVLIVEDDFISRRLLKEILSPYGSCDTVVDGEEAVLAFRLALEEKAPYDLVCMDIMMPKVDGQEALGKIREMEKDNGITGRAEVKVLMVSALDDPKNVVESYYLGGATSYVVKPITSDKIIAHIRELGMAV